MEIRDVRGIFGVWFFSHDFLYYIGKKKKRLPEVFFHVIAECVPSTLRNGRHPYLFRRYGLIKLIIELVSCRYACYTQSAATSAPCLLLAGALVDGRALEARIVVFRTHGYRVGYITFDSNAQHRTISIGMLSHGYRKQRSHGCPSHR